MRGFIKIQTSDTLKLMLHYLYKGAWCRSGGASDSELRGPGFYSHRRHHVVSLNKTHLLPIVLVKPRKHLLCPDMTEKLLAGMLSLNTNKQTLFTIRPIINLNQSGLLIQTDSDFR